MATASIKPGGGGDYLTFTAWEAAISADPTEEQVGSLDEKADASGSANTTINVSNSNGVTIKLTAGASYRFDTDASWPELGGSIGANARIDNAGAAVALNLSTSDYIVEWLEISNSGNRCVRAEGTDGIVRFCIGDGAAFFVEGYASGSVTVHHCMFIGAGSGTMLYNASGSSSLNAYHCTGFDLTRGVWKNAGTCNAYNCVMLDCGVNCYQGSPGGDYNMSTDTTAPGTTTWKSVTASNVIEDTGAGTEDLHLLDAVDGSYEGGDYSATVGSLDIDGDAISDHDVGADEIPSAGGAAAFPFHRYYAQGAGVF